MSNHKLAPLPNPNAAETLGNNRGPAPVGSAARLPHALGLALLLAVTRIGPATAASVDEYTETLLVEAVEAAAELDLYNARCRRDVAGRGTDNLNKAMVGKLKITVLSVLDDFFPEHSYRRAQRRLESEFLIRLREIGGCQGAKDSGLPAELRARYEQALDAVRALP